VRPTVSRALVVAVLAASAITALSSCSAGLRVPPPELGGVAAYTCAELHGRLPDEVDGHTVTALDPRSPYTAGWGQPTIVLRCGVEVPAALTPTSQTIVVDGVEWFPEKLTEGYLFSTVGRALTVDVSVPDAYSPEADVLVELSPVVAAHIPTSSPTPSVSPSS
jgi:hypothetical protein